MHDLHLNALQLTAQEQRVLGSLLEKLVTVPASYPMSLNALRLACNQSTNREPVTDYDEATVEATLRALRDRELVRFVWAGKGSRVVKYHQRLSEHLALDDAGQALITVLLLRGPQSPGELKARTERLHPFADRDAVLVTLNDLANRPADLGGPLVVELERRPGQHERRWVHLLGPVAESGPHPTAALVAVPNLDAVLADGPAARDAKVLAAYDTVTDAYATANAGWPQDSPFDAWLLARIAELSGPGPIADIGCGPGLTTRYLADHGMADRMADHGAAAAERHVIGYDISPAMVARARTDHPALRFEVADLRRLLRPPTASGWAAVVSWYSLIHLTPDEVTEALAALTRVLAPGGVLALALQAGPDVRHLGEGFGVPIDLDLVLHDPAQIRTAADAAGLVIDEWYLRGPITDRETAPRFYLLAHHP